jgi:hypothetical protein
MTVRRAAATVRLPETLPLPKLIRSGEDEHGGWGSVGAGLRHQVWQRDYAGEDEGEKVTARRSILVFPVDGRVFGVWRSAGQCLRM